MRAGVVTMIKKNGSSIDCFHPEAIIVGRALRVEHSCDSSSRAVVHWNIHNHDLGRVDGAHLAARLHNDVISAQTNPTSFILIVTGDFNFLPPGEYRRSIADPNGTRSAVHPDSNPGQLMNVFQPVLDKLIDIAGDLDTRYDSASQLCSRLDRIYISLPAWLVTQLHFQSSVASAPHSLHDLKISDHAPAILSISEKST